MDTDGRLTTPATRRTIVRTGAKLAYATPLVAASFKVSAVNAFAVISTPSTCGPACEAQGDCFCAPLYRGGPDICVTTACAKLSYLECRPPFDGCGFGTICVADESNNPVCAVPCGAPCPICEISGQACDTSTDCCNPCCIQGECCS